MTFAFITILLRRIPVYCQPGNRRDAEVSKTAIYIRMFLELIDGDPRQGRGCVVECAGLDVHCRGPRPKGRAAVGSERPSNPRDTTRRLRNRSARRAACLLLRPPIPHSWYGVRSLSRRPFNNGTSSRLPLAALARGTALVRNASLRRGRLFDCPGALNQIP